MSGCKQTAPSEYGCEQQTAGGQISADTFDNGICDNRIDHLIQLQPGAAAEPH